MEVRDIIAETAQYTGGINAVIFDIDNTLIELKTGKLIPSTKFLYDYCILKGFTVFIITARPSILRLPTMLQFSLLGIKIDRLIMSPSVISDDISIGKYKLRERERIQRNGYQILLSVGNKESDFFGGLYQYKFIPQDFYNKMI